MKESVICNNLICNSIYLNGYFSNNYYLKEFANFLQLNLCKLHYKQHMGHSVIKLGMQKVTSIKRKDKKLAAREATSVFLCRKGNISSGMGMPISGRMSQVWGNHQCGR